MLKNRPRNLIFVRDGGIVGLKQASWDEDESSLNATPNIPNFTSNKGTLHIWQVKAIWRVWE